MIDNIIPLFSTSASLRQGGIFTLEKAGTTIKAKKKYSPISLCDLAKDENLQDLHLIESNFVNFMLAYKNLSEISCQFKFGLKLIVCEDIFNKTEESFKSESKVIIFLKNDLGYKDLIKIYTKASTDGFYYIPRIDWKTLKTMFSENLILALPYYSSFLYRNTFTFNSIIPELPGIPIVLKEIQQDLPIDSIIDNIIDNYVKSNNYTIQNVKSIYYKNREDAKKFLIWRCILERKTYDKPNMDHMCSKEFSWEAFKELK